MIYGSWNIRCDRQKFFSFWAIFCPCPLTTQKIKILKLKKTPGDIIILHICTINDNHEMYGSSDMDHDRQHFLSFWTIFCPFTPLTTQKIKILKKGKKHLKIIIILQMCTINESHMMYGCWDMECNGQKFLSFWTNFCPFTPPNNPKNQTFEKTTDDIIILNMCTINDNYMIYGSWDMKRDGQNFFILDHFLPFYPPNNLKNQNF